MFDNTAMLVEKNIPLQSINTFHIAVNARALVRIASESDVQALLGDPEWAQVPKFVLGGGSNVVLTADVRQLVLKVEIKGKRLVHETANAFVVEAGAGENWHDFVTWTLAQGYAGLENMALIPGTVGAAPVQNVGAYGVELQDRFDSLEAIDLSTGRLLTLNAAQCAFAYRDSVFKHSGLMLTALGQPVQGLKDQALIVRVRFALPKPWRPVLGYADIEHKMAECGGHQAGAQQIFDWVCAIRRAKLPDPQVLGSAGSFFKNPTVTSEQCANILAHTPDLVHYPLPDGSVKLAAGWLIDACGWRGKSMGQVAVYEKQALVLVNRGSGSGADIIRLAQAIQTSVFERFDITLEMEPVVV